MISQETLKQLNTIYSRAHQEKGMFHFVKKFYLSNYFGSKKEPVIDNALQRLINRKPLNATETSLLTFSVFANEKIYKEFLAILPRSLQILIEKLLWVESMTDAEVEKIVKEQITVTPKYSFAEDKIVKDEYYFFSLSKQYIYSYPRIVVFYLSIHPVLKQILMEFYPKPANYYFIPIDTIPGTTLNFDVENLVINELPRLLSYYMQDGIKYSTKGRPADATLNKLQRSQGFIEFFAGDEAVGKIRHMLMAGLLYNFKIANINIDAVSVLKDLFTKQYLKLYTAQFILAELKGWSYMDKYDYNENVEHNIFEVLKQLPIGKWISTKNLMGFIECRMIPLKPIQNLALSNRLYYEKVIKESYDSYKAKKYVVNSAGDLVNTPFIKGTIFLLASFGLSEIAYEPVNTSEYAKTFYSAYDGLQYFRLTALGAYILGLSPAYQPAITQQQNKLQFSEDSLMILAEGDMAVLDVMLDNFAEKAGSNRYKVTHAHFLKDCKSKKDIDNKIGLFKRIISTKLPVYWEDQFKIWQANALKIQADNRTQLFKIPPDAKELQRILAQDAVLKSVILKAEQFYILVPAGNLSKFKGRMKELGYLVE